VSRSDRLGNDGLLGRSEQELVIDEVKGEVLARHRFEAELMAGKVTIG